MAASELASYIDLTPWHRFSFSAILPAIEACRRVHVLDFGVTHYMQWPTLIEALSKRKDVTLRFTVPSSYPSIPPSLTVPSSCPSAPPSFTISIDEVGFRLSNFTKPRDVSFTFNIIDDVLSLGSLADHDKEALVVKCNRWLRSLVAEERDERRETSSSSGGEGEEGVGVGPNEEGHGERRGE